MSKAFNVGERVIITKGEFKGREVTIMEPLQLCKDPDGDTWFGYPTDFWKDGLQISPRPHYLRRKSDDGPSASDSTDIGSWDNVGWTPHKTTQEAA